MRDLSRTPPAVGECQAPGSSMEYHHGIALLGRPGCPRVCSQSQAVTLLICKQIEEDWGLIREGNFLYSPPPKALRGKGESVEQTQLLLPSEGTSGLKLL